MVSMIKIGNEWRAAAVVGSIVVLGCRSEAAEPRRSRWVSASDDEGLEVRRVSGRSASGWLGWLLAVMKEAGNLSQVGDDGE
jgi:hypothetical protein